MTALQLRLLLISLAVTPFLGEASRSTPGSSQYSLEGLRGEAAAMGKSKNKNDINLGGGPPGYYPNKIIYPREQDGAFRNPCRKRRCIKRIIPRTQQWIWHGPPRRGSSTLLSSSTGLASPLAPTSFGPCLRIQAGYSGRHWLKKSCFWCILPSLVPQ
jgi:hypothetical protein